MGATVTSTTDASGRRTVTAERPDAAPLYFVERGTPAELQTRLAQLAEIINQSRVSDADRQNVINTLRTPRERARGELEGFVLDTALAENQRAIAEMVAELTANPPDAIIGIERGGAFLVDVLARASAVLAGRIHRIPMHRAPEGSTGSKFDVPAMQAAIQAIIDTGARRIVIVDAYMGGRTAGELRDLVLNRMVGGGRNSGVTFEMHWIREMMGFAGSPGRGLSTRGAVRSRSHEVRMAIGDDMEIVFTPDSREPITIFAADGSVQRTIYPPDGQTTRDVLIDLLSRPPTGP